MTKSARSLVKRWALAVGVALGLFLAVVVARTIGLESRQLQVASRPPMKLDVDGAVRRLSGALAFRTVSPEADADMSEFFELHEYLAREFPKLHGALERRVVHRASLLYEWAGSDPQLEPVLLLGHLDVVPVAPGSKSKWTHPPFAGRLAAGYVWGRGTLDVKFSVLAQLEAMELLVARGYQPARSLIVAFGDDEEIGGEQGAVRIAALLAKRGQRFDMVLDEGAAVVHDIVPGVRAPVALVGIAEKGYASVRLTATEAGGHSAMPPPHTAAGMIATALHRLERNPLPPSLSGPVNAQFDFLGPEMPFGMRLAVANRWLFGRVLLGRLTANLRTNALVRTTAAATMLSGSVKENVLPTQASAVVNYRIRPGDSVSAVLAHVRSAVPDPSIAVEVMPGAHEPSVVSSIEAPAFVALHRTIREVFPEVVVAPSLVVGMTDSRHYQALSDRIYRFVPMRLGPEDLERIHGTDERIAVDNYAECVRFYVRLIENVTAARAQ